MAIFGTGGGFLRGSTNFPRFGAISCGRIAREIYAIFADCDRAVGESSAFGNTKLSETSTDAHMRSALG
jgi:hypothetical protein